MHVALTFETVSESRILLICTGLNHGSYLQSDSSTSESREMVIIGYIFDDFYHNVRYETYLTNLIDSP